MEKNILTEVNRMKEIMGLNLISENRAKRLLNLIVGATDEAIEATAKNTNFENYLKMTMDEFDEKVTKLGKQVSDLTDDEIFDIFKKSPKLKSKLDMAYKEAYHNAILELTKNIKIDTQIDDIIRQVSNYEVTKDNIDTIKDIYDQLEKGIGELINDIKSGKIGETKTVPQDLLDLSDMLKVKSDEIDNQDKLFDSQDYIGRIKSAAEEGGTSVIVDLGKEKL